jgi:hypothetical protein
VGASPEHAGSPEHRSDDGGNRSDPIDRDLGRGWLRVIDRRGYDPGIDGWGGGGSICYEPMCKNDSVVWIQRRLYSKYTQV